MQGRRTTDEEDEKEYENGNVGGLCEWNGWSEQSEGSYFVKLARGRNGMSMLRELCEAADDIARFHPGLCVGGVGWGVS